MRNLFLLHILLLGAIPVRFPDWLVNKPNIPFSRVDAVSSATEKKAPSVHHTDSIAGPGYMVRFDSSEKGLAQNYLTVFTESRKEVAGFFGTNFRQTFHIRIFPDRASLDRQWQEDWKMPDYKSECWMVASGVAAGLDFLSPRCWKTDACEHQADDTAAIRKIITHEMVHVFHGQFNPSPDFSEVTGLDWLVEGLAVYASGQMDSIRIHSVTAAARAGKLPAALDAYWTGPMRYDLAGSLVMYLDLHYGRSLLKELLSFTSRKEVLDRLGIGEAELIKAYSAYWLSREQTR